MLKQTHQNCKVMKSAYDSELQNHEIIVQNSYDLNWEYVNCCRVNQLLIAKQASKDLDKFNDKKAN